MEGLYVAVRREEYWHSPGRVMGEEVLSQYSTSEEQCFITGWRAKLILRLAGLNPLPSHCHGQEKP